MQISSNNTPILQFEEQLGAALDTRVTFFGAEEAKMKDGSWQSLFDLPQEFEQCWQKATDITDNDRVAGVKVIEKITELFTKTTQQRDQKNPITKIFNSIRRHFNTSPRQWENQADIWTRRLIHLPPKNFPAWDHLQRFVKLFNPANLQNDEIGGTLVDLLNTNRIRNIDDSQLPQLNRIPERPLSLKTLTEALEPANILIRTTFWGSHKVKLNYATPRIFKVTDLPKVLEEMWFRSKNLNEFDTLAGREIIRRISDVFNKAATEMSTRNGLTRLFAHFTSFRRTKETWENHDKAIWQKRFPKKNDIVEVRRTPNFQLLTNVGLGEDNQRHILDYCDFLTLSSIGRVSRAWNLLICDCNFWHLRPEEDEKIERCFSAPDANQVVKGVCKVRQFRYKLFCTKVISTVIPIGGNSRVLDSRVVDQRVVSITRVNRAQVKLTIFNPLDNATSEKTTIPTQSHLTEGPPRQQETAIASTHIGLDPNNPHFFWLRDPEHVGSQRSLWDISGRCHAERAIHESQRNTTIDLVDSNNSNIVIRHLGGDQEQWNEVWDISNGQKQLLGKFETRVAGSALQANGFASQGHYVSWDMSGIEVYSLPHEEGARPKFTITPARREGTIDHCEIINNRLVYQTELERESKIVVCNLLGDEIATFPRLRGFCVPIALPLIEHRVRLNFLHYKNFLVVDEDYRRRTYLQIHNLDTGRTRKFEKDYERPPNIVIINLENGKKITIENPISKQSSFRSSIDLDHSNFHKVFPNDRLVIFRSSDSSERMKTMDYMWIYEISTGRKIGEVDIGNCFADDDLSKTYDQANHILMLRRFTDTSLIFIDLDNGKIAGETAVKLSRRRPYFADVMDFGDHRFAIDWDFWHRRYTSLAFGGGRLVHANRRIAAPPVFHDYNA